MGQNREILLKSESCIFTEKHRVHSMEEKKETSKCGIQLTK